ncbi:hypothetical protein FKM82_007847 [Ascaphus truei]
MEDLSSASEKVDQGKEKSQGPRKLFRRRSLRSLKSVGSFVQRLLRTFSTLSHLGEGGDRGPSGLEDDDGGFKQKAHLGGSAQEGPRLVQGGDSNNNLGKAQVAPRCPSRLSWSPGDKVPGVQGLRNHGNTCFMNAVVQCLSNTDLLAEYLGTGQYRTAGGGGAVRGAAEGVPVTDRLASLVRGLWTLEYTPQLSVEFKSTSGAAPGPTIAPPSPPPMGGQSFVQEHFQAQYRYSTFTKWDSTPQNGGVPFHIRVAGGPVTGSYLSPKDVRPLHHPAVDRALQLSEAGGPPHVKLTVEWDPKAKERLFGSIQEEVVQDAESVRSQQLAHQQQSCTLDECFHLYTKEEQLAPDDAWRCPHCKVLQQGTVKLSLWTLPDVLIIHLKRFRQVGGRRNKLSTLVSFPLSGMDMAPHLVKRGQGAKSMLGPWASGERPQGQPEDGQLDVLYDLYGVCNHHGSLQGGHYTAYCRNSLDSRWYGYDDSSVEPVPQEEVSTRGAYILFYQKRNTIPAWSASSSVRGSTSSSMSNHWVLRLSGSNRESLVSPCINTGAPLPQAPDSPVFIDKASHVDKGGIESRPFDRGMKGRSASMKVSSISKLKLGISKAMPLRWSFGSRDRPQHVTGELVEYLESGRRPKYTNESIVPLMTGAANTEKGHPKSNPAKVQDANGAARSNVNPHGMAATSTAVSQNKQMASSSKMDTLRGKPKDKVNLRQTGKAEGPAQQKHTDTRTSDDPSGISLSTAGNFLKGKASSGKKVDSNQRNLTKNGDNTRPRASKAEGQQEGRLTKLRSSVTKEPKKKSVHESPNVSELPNGASRTSLSNGVLGEGRTCGTMPSRHKENLANGMSPADIKRTHSSTNIQNKVDWTLNRSASLHKNGSASHQPPRLVSTEKSSSSTLQRMRYHTSSLGRKKSVPESSF